MDLQQTCREKQERSCTDAHVLFSFDNPLVNVAGRPKVRACAKVERPLAQQHEQRCVTVLPRSRSEEKKQKNRGLEVVVFEVLTEDLAQIF